MRWTLIFTALLLSVGVQAADSTMQVRNAWIRWLPGNLPAAGYAAIVNTSDTTQRLLSVDCADYARVMLHRSFKQNGSTHMQMIDGIDIPAHGQIALAPGGYHLMLMHAKHPIVPGDHVQLNLHFSGDRTQSVDVVVRPANATGD